MASFEFKKISLTDEHSPMKIGMDSVILGAWVEGRKATTALDIGSGCGILTFMLAQRFEEIKITGVEIFELAYDDSLENLQEFYNPMNIRFFNNDIKDWESYQKFDLIISNPPYFSGSLKPKDIGRTIARFQEELNLQDLAKVVQNHLSDSGNFSLLLALSDFETADKVFNDNGLFLHRKTLIKHLSSTVSKRALLEYRKYPCQGIFYNKLIVKNIDDTFTDEFKALTRDFYLNF